MTAAQRSPGAPKAAPKFKQPSTFARQKRLIEAAQEAALDRAAREAVSSLRERIATRLAWHEAMAAGCRAALAVVDAEVSRG